MTAKVEAEDMTVKGEVVSLLLSPFSYSRTLTLVGYGGGQSYGGGGGYQQGGGGGGGRW